MKEINKKKQVKRIFDSISHRYDFLNHFLSAGIDYYWRRKAIKLSEINESSYLLDLACGTGDFGITAKKFGVKNIFGGDLSFNMLSLFKTKVSWINGKLIETVAEHLPFKNDSFTNITVAFGVRNFYDIPTAFKEFKRVLKPNGKATVLEFSLPTNSVIKSLYMFYFRNILPLVGKIISKDDEAYTYLPESVGEFDKNINLVKIFSDCNFSKVERHSLTFGIVQVVIAQK